MTDIDQEKVELRFFLERKPVKHLYLRVRKPDGLLHVTAPLAMPELEIAKFIFQKKDWIAKQRLNILNAQAQNDDLQRISVFGETVPVCFKQGPGTLFLEQGSLTAALPRKPSPEEWAEILKLWRKAQLQEIVPPILEKWRERLGLEPLTYGIRSMKSRWGSCYPARRRIILNSELAKKQKACLELVILHELTHCLVPNHSKEFYSYLDSYLPDWREIDKLLKY